MKVALIMIAVSDLEGSGGAERLFSDLHSFMARRRGPVSVALITASSSLERLRAARHLDPSTDVIALRLGPRPGHGKLRIFWMTLRLLGTTLSRGFDVVQICLPSPIYVPFVAVMGWLPRAIAPRTAITVIDCTLASSLEAPPAAPTYERQVLDAHRMYFRWAKSDGIYSWYQTFVDIARRRTLVGPRVLVRAAKYCFTDPVRFAPAASKDHLVVFAGRLSEQKRPLLFVDAVAALRRQEPALLNGWRFELYGKGLLGAAVVARIAHHRLGDVMTLSHAVDMAPILARSRLFVSTQAIENFTSLAMLEAMAAGNAVVAEAAGQTGEFVRHGVNGYLVQGAEPEAFARAIADYMRNSGAHNAMAKASRALTTEVHTVEHFADDITQFWRDLLPATLRT